MSASCNGNGSIPFAMARPVVARVPTRAPLRRIAVRLSRVVIAAQQIRLLVAVSVLPVSVLPIRECEGNVGQGGVARGSHVGRTRVACKKWGTHAIFKKGQLGQIL